jgi:hypothetical protein
MTVRCSLCEIKCDVPAGSPVQYHCGVAMTARTLPASTARDIVSAIEAELRYRGPEPPPGLTAEQRAVVRAERVKREYGPRSKLWKRCIAFRDRLTARMSMQDVRTVMDAVAQDKRARGR